MIEQEAGIAEYDAKDRPFIWSLTGGEQRYASGLVDGYVADDVDSIRQQLLQLLDAPSANRAGRHGWYLERLASLGNDCPQLDAAAVRALYQGDAP
ncbi:Malonyl-S-ACP:biotin-protein carboxyltransferase MADC [compost metagenome]